MNRTLGELLNEASLHEIVNSTVRDALRPIKPVAAQERALQQRVEKDLDATTHDGKQKKEIEQELADDPLAGAPKRAPEIGAPEQPGQQAPAMQQQGQEIATASSVEKKIDQIRAGMSLKDKAVFSKIEQLLASTDPEEVRAADAMLGKLASIINPTVDSQGLKSAPEPQGNVDARLDMLNQRKTDLKAQSRGAPPSPDGAAIAAAPQQPAPQPAAAAAPRRAPAPEAAPRRPQPKGVEDTSPPKRVPPIRVRGR